MSYVIGTNRLRAGCHRQDREIRKYKETISTLCRLFMEYPGNKIKKITPLLSFKFTFFIFY